MTTTPNEPNPFAEMVEEDYHRALLETGNLPNLRSGSHKWTGKNCWIAEGFLAKYRILQCKCGKITPLLQGVFTIESNEEKKASRFVPFPKGQALPAPGDVPYPTELLLETTEVCAHCLPRHGFPDVYMLHKNL